MQDSEEGRWYVKERLNDILVHHLQGDQEFAEQNVRTFHSRGRKKHVEKLRGTKGRIATTVLNTATTPENTT